MSGDGGQFSGWNMNQPFMMSRIFSPRYPWSFSRFRNRSTCGRN